MKGEKHPNYGKPAANRLPPKPQRPCACGCGRLATAGRTYISGHNTAGTRLSTFTGRYVSGGYVRIWIGEHPYADRDGFALEHRIVVEKYLRQHNPASSSLVRLGERVYLDPGLVVHHRNGDKQDNRLDNLEVMSCAEHTALHHAQGDIRR